mgnify:CR=1 FL=1
MDWLAGGALWSDVYIDSADVHGPATQRFAVLMDVLSAHPALAAAMNSVRSLRKRGRHVQVGLMLAEHARAPLPMDRIIAFELDISPRTVEIYRANLMDKLGVRSVAEAVRIAFAAGLVSVLPK